MSIPWYSPVRLGAARRLTRRWTNQGEVPAITVAVGDAEQFEAWPDGSLQPSSCDAPTTAETNFLVASITKPIVVLGVLTLVEEGLLKLQDRVVQYVPEFSPHGKRNIRLLHLMTHTSGLPDMLPNNLELRRSGASMERFVEATCAVEPNFLPGRDVSYQSMGLLMLAEIVRRATGRCIAELLNDRIFEPLGMRRTALGAPDSWFQSRDGRPPIVDQIADIPVDPDEPLSATWNTEYWRHFGAPWGGLLSTADDLGRLAQHLLRVHRGQPGIVAPATLATMTSNRLNDLPEVPEANRRCLGWGYGWQMVWRGHATTLGDFLSDRAYGHWGATGTLMWIDPERRAFLVALSNRPLENGPRRLTQLSNAICAAWLP